MVVACWTYRIAGALAVTIRSTLRRTSSPASSGSRSMRPSAERYSMARSAPSCRPRSARPARRSLRKLLSASTNGDRTPMTGRCCAEPRDENAVTLSSATKGARTFRASLLNLSIAAAYLWLDRDPSALVGAFGSFPQAIGTGRIAPKPSSMITLANGELGWNPDLCGVGLGCGKMHRERSLAAPLRRASDLGVVEPT